MRLIDQVVTLISVGILEHVVSSLISVCLLDQVVTLDFFGSFRSNIESSLISFGSFRSSCDSSVIFVDLFDLAVTGLHSVGLLEQVVTLV